RGGKRLLAVPERSRRRLRSILAANRELLDRPSEGERKLRMRVAVVRVHVRALEVAQEPRRDDAERRGARVDEVRREKVAAGLEGKRRAEPLALYDDQDDEGKHEQERRIAEQHV